MLPFEVVPLVNDPSFQRPYCDQMKVDHGHLMDLEIRMLQREALTSRKVEILIGDKYDNEKITLSLRCSLRLLTSYSRYFREEIAIQNGAYMVWGLNAFSIIQVVDYMHTSTLIFDKENVLDLTEVAHRFGIKILMEHLTQYTMAYLDFESCLKAYYLFKKLNLPDFYGRIESFIRDNFQEVLQSDGFLEASANTLANILESDQLCVDDEEDIYSGIISWVKRDLKHRKCDAKRLLFMVRFPMMRLDLLRRVVEHEPLVNEDVSLILYRTEAINFVLLGKPSWRYIEVTKKHMTARKYRKPRDRGTFSIEKSD